MTTVQNHAPEKVSSAKTGGVSFSQNAINAALLQTIRQTFNGLSDHRSWRVAYPF